LLLVFCGVFVRKCIFLFLFVGHLFPATPKVTGGYVFAGVDRYIAIFVSMFVKNFLAAIQVRLPPNLVSHTLGHRGRGD